jgi:hypothetical protein
MVDYETRVNRFEAYVERKDEEIDRLEHLKNMVFKMMKDKSAGLDYSDAEMRIHGTLPSPKGDPVYDKLCSIWNIERSDYDNNVTNPQRFLAVDSGAGDLLDKMCDRKMTGPEYNMVSSLSVKELGNKFVRENTKVA